MGAATQASLRRNTWIYAALLMVVTLMVTCFVRESTVMLSQYEFDKEMILRASYLSAMSIWIPGDQLIDNDALEDIYYKTPFSVAVKAAAEFPVKVDNMAMSSGFPTSVYKYCPTTDTVLNLTEGEITFPVTGLNEEFIATGVCFTFLMPLILFTALSIANVVARGGHTAIAKGVIWVGFIALPSCVLLLMLSVFASLERNAFIQYWKEDVSRSAQLYVAMFEAMAKISSLTDATRIVNTFEWVNSQAQDDNGGYQVVVAIGDAKEVSPALNSQKVYERLFAHANVTEVEFVGYVDEHVYAAASVPSFYSLVVVSRKIAHIPGLMDAQYLMPFIICLVVTLVLGCAMLLGSFPFAALGQLSLAYPNGCPGDGRLSKYWAHEKLLEGVVLLVVVIVVFVMALTRLATHLHRVEVLTDYYHRRMSAINGVEVISHLIASCYVGVLGSQQWTLDYLKHSSVEVGSIQELQLARFYDILTTTLVNGRYASYAVSDMLSSQAEANWPLLVNLANVQQFIQEEASSSLEAVVFQHWVWRYDNTIIIAMLTSNEEFLEYGDPALQAQVEASLTTIATPTFTEADMAAAFDTLVLSFTPYLELAQTFSAQTVTTETYVELYASDLGVNAVEIEEGVMASELMQVEPSRYISLSYMWDSFNSFYVLLMFTIVFSIYMAWTTLYVPMFFAGVQWRWLRQTTKKIGREPLIVSIRTHDHTSPRDHMVVDMHSLRQGVHGIWGFTVFIVCFTILIGVIMLARCIFTMETLNAQMLYLQSAMVPLSNRAYAASIIDASLASWSRAYLSLSPEMINRAIGFTCVWNDMKPIVWTGGASEADLTRVRSGVITEVLDGAQKMAIQASILRQDSVVDAIYRDEIRLLNMWDNYFHFSGYQTCFGGLIYMWELFANRYLRCVVAGAPNSCYEPAIASSVAISMVCMGRGLPSDFQAYLQRIQNLQTRSYNTFSHKEVSQILQASTEDVNDEVEDMVELFLETFDTITTVESLSIPWLTLGYGWIAVLALVLLYRSSSRVQKAIYHS